MLTSLFPLDIALISSPCCYRIFSTFQHLTYMESIHISHWKGSISSCTCSRRPQDSTSSAVWYWSRVLQQQGDDLCWMLGSSGFGSLGMTSRSGTVGSSAFALVLVVLVLCVSGGNGQLPQQPQVFTTMFTTFAGPNNVRVLPGGQEVQLLLDQVSGMAASQSP